jgi:hypothetical protein
MQQETRCTQFFCGDSNMKHRPTEAIHIDYNFAITEARREQGRTVFAGWRWLKDQLHGATQPTQSAVDFDERGPCEAKAS